MSMFYYAQLNDDNVCIGVSSLSGEVDVDNMIRIDSNSEDYFYRKYENGEWSEEKYVPDHAQIELTRMEALEQSQAEQDDLLMDLMLGRV